MSIPTQISRSGQPNQSHQRPLRLVICVTLLTVFLATTYLALRDCWRCQAMAIGVFRRTATDFAVAEGETETYETSRSPRVVAGYYRSSNAAPLVLLAHGSYTSGRRHSLNRLLANRLVAKGFSVLALDLPGFGDSEDPILPLNDDFKFEHAVVSAARFAFSKGWAKPGELVYIGHSLGAGVLLRASRLDPRPAAVIALGAPVCGWSPEEFREPSVKQFAVQRFVEMRMEPDEQSVAVMTKYLFEMGVVRQLNQGNLPPILLVYGELEADKPQITAFPSVELHVVRRAPHDYYAIPVLGPLILHNNGMIDSVIRAADLFIWETLQVTQRYREGEPVVPLRWLTLRPEALFQPLQRIRLPRQHDRLGQQGVAPA